MTIPELKQLLQRPYNRTDWHSILREVFPQVSILAHPTSIVCDHQDVEYFQQLGNVHLTDDKNLAIFEIALSHRVKIPRNRVELRNLVAKHIDQEINHGVLVIFIGQNDDYRFTFTAKESEFSDDGEFVERQTATKRFTYLLGPHETCTTAARRLLQLGEKKARATLIDVVDAFSVEKLNIEFFNRYKEHYTSFVSHLLSGDVPQQVFGIPRLADEKEQDKANKPVRDFAKRLLGRLVFLYFLQKKGWLGCPTAPADWINGDREFVRNLFLACPNREKFYSTRLVPLFFEALNQPDRPQSVFPITGTRVPYLNGGLFEHEKLPNDHKPLPVEKLDFPATLFEQLLEFFGQYNFTIDENDPDDHEVGIDPEMLGHIFENLLEDNKDKGAFYTPKAIVQYMCQQSLINYLQQHLEEREEIVNLVRFKDAGSATDKTNWVRKNAKHIEELLDLLKICDPAIGSGAFPIGLLQEIYWIKLTLDWTLDPAETKLKIIQNSIYGVDIDAGAVEIARLRFWLSIIVDEDEPRPLPNLDYKIMQGDSLLESFEGIPLDNLQQAKGFKVQVFSKQGQGQMFAGDLLDYSSTENSAKAKEISSLIKRYFGETNPVNKLDLHKRIDRFVLDHIDYNLQIQEEKINDELTLRKAEIKRKAGLVKGWKPPKKDEQRLAALEDGLKSIALKKEKLRELEEKPERPYFLWHLFFQDVFEQGGFDIFIANPPYVRHEAIKHYKPFLEARYKCFCGTADLYTYFYEQGITKLRDNGILCYISSNKYMRAGYGENIRKLLVSQTIDAVIDFCELPVFAAATDPAIIFLSKQEPSPDHKIFSAVIKEQAEIHRLLPALSQRGITILQSSLTSASWTLASPDVLALLAKLQNVSTPLVEYVQGSIYYGIKTGRNEAFEIDEKQRQMLISENPNSADLIRPWLHGRDNCKWKAKWAGYYLITIASSANHEWPWSKEKSENSARKIFSNTYPAVYRHLALWEEKLKNRDDQGQFWWELRSCAYYTEFEHSKIIYPIVAKEMRASLDLSGILHNDKCFMIPRADFFLLAIMNSRLMDYYFRQNFAGHGDPFKGGRLEFRGIFMEHMPVAPASDAIKAPIIERVQQILSNTNGPDVPRLESEIDCLVYALYGLTAEEIATIESSRVTQPESPDRKTILFTRLFPTLKKESAYFSLSAVKRLLMNTGIELSDDTLREYMSEAMATGVVSDAGRGWYSRHTKPVSLDSKPVAIIIRDVKKAFPLLNFCCWSTVQFNSFAQHLIAQPTILLYAESDTLETVADFLRDAGWKSWANPGKADVERFVRPGEGTVILRPAKSGQPEAKDHVAPIEKALVDLIVEANKLHLMDSAEVQRIIDTVLGAGLLQLTVLFGYAEDLKKKIESKEVTR
jgi:hypothetical protein